MFSLQGETFPDFPLVFEDEITVTLQPMYIVGNSPQNSPAQSESRESTYERREPITERKQSLTERRESVSQRRGSQSQRRVSTDETEYDTEERRGSLLERRRSEARRNSFGSGRGLIPIECHYSIPALHNTLCNVTLTFRPQTDNNVGIYVKIKAHHHQASYGIATVSRERDSVHVHCQIQNGVILCLLDLTYPGSTSESIFMDGLYRVSNIHSGQSAVWRAEVAAGNHIRKHWAHCEFYLRGSTHLPCIASTEIENSDTESRNLDDSVTSADTTRTENITDHYLNM